MAAKETKVLLVLMLLLEACKAFNSQVSRPWEGDFHAPDSSSFEGQERGVYHRIVRRRRKKQVRSSSSSQSLTSRRRSHSDDLVILGIKEVSLGEIDNNNNDSGEIDNNNNNSDAEIIGIHNDDCDVIILGRKDLEEVEDADMIGFLTNQSTERQCHTQMENFTAVSSTNNSPQVSENNPFHSSARFMHQVPSRIVTVRKQNSPNFESFSSQAPFHLSDI